MVTGGYSFPYMSTVIYLMQFNSYLDNCSLKWPLCCSNKYMLLQLWMALSADIIYIDSISIL